MSRPKNSKNIIKPEEDMSEELEKMKLEMEKMTSELQLAKEQLSQTKTELEDRNIEIRTKGGRLISSDEIDFSKKQVGMSNDKAALKEKIEKQKSYDNQMVTGKFLNRRAPGQAAKLTYMKYDDDEVKWYTFVDGQTYTIKRGFVEQINEHYCTPLFNQQNQPINSDGGSIIESVDTSNKKYAFVPSNF